MSAGVVSADYHPAGDLEAIHNVSTLTTCRCPPPSPPSSSQSDRDTTLCLRSEAAPAIIPEQQQHQDDTVKASADSHRTLTSQVSEPIRGSNS